MSSAATCLTRCLLFLLLAIGNALSLLRAVKQGETATAYLSAGVALLAGIGFLYFGLAYIRRRKQ